VTDPVHNTSQEPGRAYASSWEWSNRYGEHFRRCSYCGSINPEDLAAEQVGGDSCTICHRVGWSECFQNQRPMWADNIAVGALSPEQREKFDKMAPTHAYNPGGWYASWADWKYGWPHKFYVDIPNRNPDSISVLSVAYHDPRESRVTGNEREWTHFNDLTAEQREVVYGEGHIRDDDKLGQGQWFQFFHREKHGAKFYTVHLGDPNLSEDVKNLIQKACGIEFTFEHGTVTWRKYYA
jgi:hypothetical protein